MTKYLAEKPRTGRVYIGPQFKDIVHHVMVAGA